MDNFDKKLIKLLEQDSRRTSNELAKLLNSSSSTVRRRIRKLIESDIITIGAYVNPEKLGIVSAAVVGLNVAADKISSVMKLLFEKNEVTWAANTMGRFDIICVARFSDNSQMTKFLQTISKLDGVTRSEGFYCLETLGRPQFGGSTIDILGNL